MIRFDSEKLLRKQEVAKSAPAGEAPHPDNPILTTLEELYKIGLGPSSSHTMGPMRAGLNFYHALSGVDSALLKKATGLRVWLYGSLSATGKGHGTDWACLAGLLGNSPLECTATLLDALATEAEALSRDSEQRKLTAKTYDVEVGGVHLAVGLGDIIFADVVGDFKHPNTMRIALVDDEQVLFERTYYSVGGGFIEWDGSAKEKKCTPPYPYETMTELLQHVESGPPLVFVLLKNEMALTGKTESDIWAFLDTVIDVMARSVDDGLATTGELPGSIGLLSKAGTLFSKYSALDFTADKAITVVSSFAIACAEENARGHVIVTAPTAGSAGVMAGAVYTMLKRNGGSRQDIREGLLIAAAIGYLCKHNATLSGAEGGCQAEIGVASAMAAAFLAHNQGRSPAVVEHSAESALEHHLGLTCDPVGGYVQVPCIERCAFGVIKAITACCIACGELPKAHRVGFDTCVEAMALTAQAMSRKYKETSEGGLAVALVLC